MLAWPRRTLPGQVARVLDAGEADATMAHRGVVTPRLVSAACGRGAELFVWTVDDPRRPQPRLAHDVNGIKTDRWGILGDA